MSHPPTSDTSTIDTPTIETDTIETDTIVNPRMVALGGGHGLYTMLTALRTVTTDLTAVVTVADDGGSSGRIRREFDVLPPGDLRMALAALSGPADRDQDWAELYQHRLGGTGALAGHPVGNLVLTGLFERMGDPVAALDLLGRSLGAVGRVLPMSEVPLDLVATIEPHDRDDPVRGRRIRGQSAIASSPGRVREVAIRPADAPACRAATDAVRAADVVVLGPGSWFTSVLPHLLLPELARAVVETRGRVVVTLNLVPQPGETDGFSPAEYLHVLRRYCPDLRVDAVIADENHSTASPDAPDRGSVELTRAAAGLGAVLILADLCEPDRDDRHRPVALAAAMRLALERAPGPSGPAAGADSDLIEHAIEHTIEHTVPARLVPQPAPGNAGARR
jgi:uncharacterized cofD-like protein